MAEEHLHCLHIVFYQFREHNLKLKPSKCDFYRNKITYLTHWVSKDGVHPSNSNLEAITECTLPQTYTEVCTFLGLVGHYRRFIKEFAHITKPLSEYLAGEGPPGSWSRCHSPRMPWKLLKHSNRHAWQLLFWCLLTIPNHSCWRLMHPKMDLGQCCHRSKQTGGTILFPMAAEPWCHTRRTIIQPNLNFWCWNGQLQSTLKSTFPTSHL